MSFDIFSHPFTRRKKKVHTKGVNVFERSVIPDEMQTEGFKKKISIEQ